VLLHGRPVESIPRSEIVELVGYVGQEPTLFPGTICDNLTLGRSGITIEDLDDACRRANIYDDVMKLDAGYETIVSQRGGNLSGGQRQRLCIARALLQTPKIMLLDEPTSALDGPSQAVVQKAIDDLDDVTMLVVAHRLSTLKTMDRIIVLDEGRIVEDGTYAELAIGDGQFAKMLASERWAA
jgi:ATP-binding cassette subfamily B protein